MTIKELKADAPDWNWTAEHYGMGWRYKGERNGKRITVYAVARLCGPSDDDFATEWRVDDGCASESYSSWWFNQVARRQRPPKNPTGYDGDDFGAK